MSYWLVAFVGLLILPSVGPAGSASAAAETPRPVTIQLDVAHRLGPLRIDKVASLGQGGQAPDPIWAGGAAEVRALHPRLCFKPKVLFPRIDRAIVERNEWDELGRTAEGVVVAGAAHPDVSQPRAAVAE